MSLPVKQGCVIEAFKKGEVDVIGHVVNGQKVWGAGVAKTLKQEFPEAYESYLRRCGEVKVSSALLGDVDLPLKGFAPLGVASLFAQDRYGTEKRQLDYGALAVSLSRLKDLLPPGEKVGIPYLMGCGLAGGSWEVVEELVEGILVRGGISVTAYKL